LVDTLRARPHEAFLVVQAFPPRHRLPETGELDRTVDTLMGACVWFFSRLGHDTETWRPEGETIVALIDGLVVSEPALVGLLYLRAQVVRVLGDVARSERDLAALAQLPRAREDDAFWAELYRAWIELAGKPRALLARLPAPPPLAPHELRVLERWRRDRPAPFALRKEDAFVRWFDSFRVSPPGLSGGADETILRLDFEDGLVACPGGAPLRAVGVELVKGRRGRGLWIGSDGVGLCYAPQALDPREGTFMAWVRPDWEPAAPDDATAPTRYLFGFQPKQWENEMRVWSWRSQHLAGRAHWRYGEEEPAVLSVPCRRLPKARAWTHVAFTWSASAGELAIYSNGELQRRERGFRPPRTTEATTPPLSIGSHPTAEVEGWGGTIDDVVLLLRALSEDEVAEAHRASR
jgi:hypothetical protein